MIQMFKKHLILLLILPAIISCQTTLISDIKTKFFNNLGKTENVAAPAATNCSQVEKEANLTILANELKQLYVYVASGNRDFNFIALYLLQINSTASSVMSACDQTVQELYKEEMPYFLKAMPYKPSANKTYCNGRVDEFGMVLAYAQEDFNNFNQDRIINDATLLINYIEEFDKNCFLIEKKFWKIGVKNTKTIETSLPKNKLII